MAEIIPRRLRLYQFLYDQERLTVDEIPDPYKSKIKVRPVSEEE